MIHFFEEIRDGIKRLNNLLISLFKVLGLSRFFVKYPHLSSEKFAFLANGPSLDDALVKMREDGLSENIMVTNFFCKSVYFEELQPSYYTICDPLFNYDGYKTDERIADFYDTIYNVSWELNFFIPYFFKKGVEKIIKEGQYRNQKVEIYYYNSVNFNGDGNLLLYLMRLRLGIPRASTVAVPAIFNCMFMGANMIQIGGMDLNQHLDIMVGKDNIVKIKAKHFYNKEEKVVFKPWMKADGKSIKTSEIFQVFYRYFYSLDIMAKYVDKYNIEIKNYSENSFLDQFKKV